MTREEDAISRQIISEYVGSHIQEINSGYGDLNNHTNRILRMIVDYIEKMEPVAPQQKTGHWILAQRDKCIDINCSECGNTRIKDYAYGYTVDELDLDEVNDLIVKNQMYYCEHCGAKMQGVAK